MNSTIVQNLLYRVPTPPNYDIPRGVTEEELEAFQSRTGLTVPPELRDWLQLSNGPCVGPGGLFGVGTPAPYLDIEYYLVLYPSWKERKWIPIAGDGCGNYYLVATRHEYCPGYPVLFFETSQSVDEPSYVVASSIWLFLYCLFNRELGDTRWPFNAEAVTKIDPGILEVVGVRLPWSAE